jgi:hypothetical protein
MDSTVVQAFNTEAQIVAGMGVTITVSSGDNGAPEYRSNTCLCSTNSVSFI